jgi:hypothetical protein
MTDSARPAPVPRLLTPQLSDRICELVRNGNFLKDAAKTVGVDQRTIRTWRNLGAQGIEPYAAFVRAFNDAEGASKNIYILAIRRAALTDWKAAAWMLEHRWNEDWGYRAIVTHTVDEELKRILDVVERHAGAEITARIFAELSDGADSSGAPSGDPEGAGEPRH